MRGMLTHKTNNELDRLALKICQMLNGLPVGQALNVAQDRVPLILCDGQMVDTSSQRFSDIQSNIESAQ